MVRDPWLDDDVPRARAGDSAARERVLSGMRPRVQVMVRARLGAEHRCWHVIEDLTQEVVLALAGCLQTLASDAPPAFRLLVSRLVQHKVADHYRHRRRQRTQLPRLVPTPPTGSAFELLHGVHAATTSPSGKAARAEEIDMLLSELAALPAPHREVLTLAFFDHLDTAEIGEALGTTRPSAAMRVLRALRALRDNWQERTGQRA